jgi:hypothetical protein
MFNFSYTSTHKIDTCTLSYRPWRPNELGLVAMKGCRSRSCPDLEWAMSIAGCNRQKYNTITYVSLAVYLGGLVTGLTVAIGVLNESREWRAEECRSLDGRHESVE